MTEFNIDTLSGWTVKEMFIRNQSRELDQLFLALESDIERMLERKKIDSPKDYLASIYLVMRQDIMTYDFDRYKFGVFLYYVVEKAVRSMGAEDHLVHLTKRECELVSKRKRFSQKEYATNGTYPTLEEAAEYLGVDPIELEEIESRMNIISLDAPVGDEEDGLRMVDMLEVADETASFQRSEMRADVRRCINYLVKKRVVKEEVAKSFLEYYSPELEAMGIPELETIAYENGYNSSSALDYHLKSVARALLDNPYTRMHLSEYLGMGA